jgi:hypothetical protein
MPAIASIFDATAVIPSKYRTFSPGIFFYFIRSLLGDVVQQWE